MSALAAMQRRFVANLDVEDDAAARSALIPDLVDRGRLPVDAQVAIYRNNSKTARINVLKQVYPVCLAILGERCFRALARDHVYAHPSLKPDLNHYGDDFPQTLRRFLAGLDEAKQSDFDGMQYLPDLACFECLWHGLHFCADDPCFCAQAFARDAATNPGGIRLIPSHALRLFQSPWPIHALWSAHRGGGSVPTAPSESDRLVLWRAGFEPRVERVDRAMFELLAAVLAGATVETLGNADSGSRLGECLIRGWIVGHRAAD